MAIKQFKLLGSTEVADGPFRSLTEVERYLGAVKVNLTELESLLRQLQTQFAKNETATIEFVVNRDDKLKPKGGSGSGNRITLDKVVVPKLDSLRKNFSIVEELSDKVEMLDSLYNSVAVNFKDVRGSKDTLNNIKAMQKSAKAKMDEALKFLNTVGSKYVPTEFKELIETTIGYVSPNLTFKSHETLIYAYETNEGHVAFSVYIKLKGLIDDEGHQYPEFYIVFTCILKPSSERGKVDAHYYVTVMQDFSAPGKYLLGKEVDSPAKAASALGLMLEMENISTAIGVLPHNLDPKKLKKDKFSIGSRIAKIEVDPNAISFHMLKGVSKVGVEEAAKALYMEMKGMLAHIKKAKLKVRIGQDEGRFVIRFTLTNLAREDQVSINDIDFLKEHFPQLDDTKLRQVVKVINSD